MNTSLRIWTLGVSLWLAVLPARGQWPDISGHLKYQPNLSFQKEDSLQQEILGSTAHEQILDFRVNSEWRKGRFGATVHGETLALGGTALKLREQLQTPLTPETPLGLGDERRLFDLSIESASDRQFQMFHRLDRAEVGYYGESFVGRVGRQAFTVGNGLVFQVLDLFNPFSPIEIDKDYKTGEDMLYGEFLLTDQERLETLIVGRRDENRNITADQGSFAAILHSSRLLESSTMQGMVAQHFDDLHLGFGSSTAISESILRFDALFARGNENEWFSSFVANIDSSFVLFGMNTYVYIEYYRNGFGISDRRYSTPDLDLIERQLRGEVYVLGRDLTSLGGRLELSPLVNLLINQIVNINDGSGLHQIRAEYDVAQDFSVQFGTNLPFGRKGSEFGGPPIGELYLRPSPQLYLRSSYFF